MSETRPQEHESLPQTARTAESGGGATRDPAVRPTGRPLDFEPIQQAETFEQALARLESIVSLLENPDVTLEDSVKLYEEGLRLSKRCSLTLETATQRIEEIQRAADT